jgi:hypothetical protein
MPIDTYPEQPQPPTHIDNKLADLHMSGPSAREPSGPATVGPIFIELPRYASEPPHATQALNYHVRPSAYSDGWSAYDHGRSGHMAGQSAHAAGRFAYPTERSGTGLFKEDCYLNPRPYQQHFRSHYTMHQPINTESQVHGGEYFPAPPRRPERNVQSYELYRANSNTPQNPNQWVGRQQTNVQTTSPMIGQRAGGLPPAAIDIVREEIVEVFRDKLGVSMVHGGQSYQRPYNNRFDHHPYP